MAQQAKTEDRKSAEKEKNEKSPHLKLVVDNVRAERIRSSIRIIAESSRREHLISDDTYDEYRALARGDEEGEMTLEMLEKTRIFAEEHEKRARRVHDKITAAKVSETDEAYLMKSLVANNFEFTTETGARTAEQKIDGKLLRIEECNDDYEKLENHPLIKNTRYLKVDASTRIKFPDKKAFLKLTRPERRDLLDQLEKALPEAEIYASTTEDGASKKLTKAYTTKLKKALVSKIIGESTYNKFMEGFSEVDAEEKQFWLSEFDGEMGRYKDLWTQIRGTLQGPALSQIEGHINGKGHTELLAEFTRLQGTESSKLSLKYASDLGVHREKGTIGRHSQAQFVIWMQQQDLTDQYASADKLPEEMKRYEDLWSDIDQLNGKQQSYLKEKQDIWGFSELEDQYNAFKEGRGVLGGQVTVAPKEDPLSQIQSNEVKEAILETDELLEKQGSTKKTAFMQVLTNMFKAENSNSFDAYSFEDTIRGNKAAANDNDMTEHEKFTQVVVDEGEGESHREAQVVINDEKSMDHLFAEDQRNRLRSKDRGGKDRLSLAVEGRQGNKVEINELKDIRALEKFLGLKTEDESLDEAA